jgi:outer membrane protein assembly factor BamD
MKKYILGLFAVAVVASCVSQQERAMKSADKEFILKAANENFAKKSGKMHWLFTTDLPIL